MPHCQQGPRGGAPLPASSQGSRALLQALAGKMLTNCFITRAAGMRTHPQLSRRGAATASMADRFPSYVNHHSVGAQMGLSQARRVDGLWGAEVAGSVLLLGGLPCTVELPEQWAAGEQRWVICLPSPNPPCFPAQHPPGSRCLRSVKGTLLFAQHKVRLALAAPTGTAATGLPAAAIRNSPQTLAVAAFR